MKRGLIATAIAAIGLPLGASAWVRARTDDVAAHASQIAGVPVEIGGIDAALTGTVRLSDVAFGSLVRADSVEASVSLESLLAGELRADEVRVAAPRVEVAVDADGESDLGTLVKRFAKPRAASAKPARVRRIVVDSGTLVARVAGVGEIAADGVELVPDETGVRVVTGPVRVAGRAGPLQIQLAFARSAADVALPRVRFGRVLAVGGTGAIGALALRDVAAGRLAPDRALEIRAAADDGGVPRPLAIDVRPRDLAVEIRGDHVPVAAFASLAPRGLGLDGARATGSLVVQRGAAATSVMLDAQLAGAQLEHPTLAAFPVPLDATVRATATIGPEAIAVPRLALDVGAQHWTASGWWRRSTPASAQLDVELAEAPCASLLASLPAELRGPLDGMALSGAAGGRARLSIDLAAPDGDGVALQAAFTGGCRTDAEPPAADVGALLKPGDSPLDLHALPGHVPGAFVAAEDSRFYEHGGFDLAQIARSLEIDLREHRLARGGSTISQQLVKNAFLTQRRTLDRKLQEAVLTARLEARLSKRQILERYLGIIELGPRIRGLAAAARYWFDCAPNELTVRQAAFLAALTSEPATMSRRVRRAGGLDADSAARVDTVLRAMKRDGAIDAGEFDDANGAPLHFAKSALRSE